MPRVFHHSDGRRIEVEPRGGALHVVMTLDDGDPLTRTLTLRLGAYVDELTQGGFVEHRRDAPAAEPASFETWLARWRTEAPDLDLAPLEAELLALSPSRASTILAAIDATYSPIPHATRTDAERLVLDAARDRLSAVLGLPSSVAIAALLLALRDARADVADACFPIVTDAIDRSLRERNAHPPAWLHDVLLALVVHTPSPLCFSPPAALAVMSVAQPASPAAIDRLVSAIERAEPDTGADLAQEAIERLDPVPDAILDAARARLEVPAFTRIAAMAITRGPRTRSDGDRLRAVFPTVAESARYDLTRALIACGDTETARAAFSALDVIAQKQTVSAYASRRKERAWLESLLTDPSVARSVKDEIIDRMSDREEYARQAYWRKRLDAPPVKRIR